MAGCERGYLCTVCGREVEEITESDLYLRYVLGEAEWDELNRCRKAHSLQSRAGSIHRGHIV